MAEASAHPAVAGIDRAIERVRQVYGRWRRSTPMEQMRQDWDALFGSDAVPVRLRPVNAGGVEACWIAHDLARPDRVLVYFHGGGYKMGSVTSHRDLMARLSRAGRCRVLGVNYRLLPEHRFPAPVEDASTVYRWLLSEGVSASRIVLAGDSAGGGIAASALLALKAQGLPLPAGAVLLSAWLDMSLGGASYETRAAADPIHQRPMLQAIAAQYLGEVDPRDPRASPLFGDLSGLPPLLLQVGDRETGLDDSTAFAAKARQAGVPVELEVWDGMIHVFQQFPDELPEAQQAIANIGVFLNTIWSQS